MDGGFPAQACLMTSPAGHPLERLVYRSDATGVAEGSAELSDIVATSLRNNAKQAITGALACHGSILVHVMEGEAETLSALMGVIEQDDRHRNVRVLARWPVQARLFPGQAMVLVGTRKLSPHLFRLVFEVGSGAQVTGVMVSLANPAPASPT